MNQFVGYLPYLPTKCCPHLLWTHIFVFRKYDVTFVLNFWYENRYLSVPPFLLHHSKKFGSNTWHKKIYHFMSFVPCIVTQICNWIKIDQLDVTCFIISLFTAQHVSNVSTAIFRYHPTPRQPHHTVTPTHIEPEQYNTWNKSTISRKLLTMDVY